MQSSSATASAIVKHSNAVSIPAVAQRTPNPSDAPKRASPVAVPSIASPVPRSRSGVIVDPSAASTPSVIE